MANYAIIDTTGKIDNIVVVDPLVIENGQWAPGENFSAIEIPNGIFVNIGWIYNNNQFSAPADNENEK